MGNGVYVSGSGETGIDPIIAKAREEFQNRLDSTPEGATLRLSRGEHPGPVSITRRLTLDGQGATIWALEGPVVSVLACGVVLRNLTIEVTGETATGESARDCALMISPGLGITLEGVEVSGLVQGLPGEEGTWRYPRVLHLGQLAPKSDHRFRVGVLVPVPCQIDSQIAGLEVEPRHLAPGPNEVVLRIGGLFLDTLLSGRLVLSSGVKRRITVCGHVKSAAAGPAGPGPDPQSYLWLPPDWWSLTGRTPPRPATGGSWPATVFDPPPPTVPTPPNGAAGPVRQPPTVVVSPTDETQYRTVGDAIRDVEPGTRIVVRPGVYKESLVVDKRLELIGDGPREQIIIEGTPCLRLQTDWARVQNLSLRAVAAGGRRAHAVSIAHGQPILERCEIRSDALACVAVQGPTANPVLLRCTIRDGKSAGILVLDDGRGVVEECEIFGHALAGVEIRQRGSPTLRRCRIRDGQQVGVLVHDYGQGALEECEIVANTLAGVEIRERGNPVVRGCTIRDGKDPGVLVHTDGRGTLLNCEVAGNARAGVEVRHGGAPTLQLCRIHHGKQAGLLFAEDASGTVEDCIIAANALAGIEIRARAHPVIRRCKVNDGQQVGVAVHDGGAGTIEDSELVDNAHSGLEMWLGGNPVVRGGKICGNRQAGVLVAQKGRGKLEGCDITGNAGSGVIIADGGQLNIRRCDIHGGQLAGIAVCRHGTGTVVDCSIHDNALSGVAITQGGSPTFQSCRITGNGDVGVWAFDKGSGRVLDCILTGNKGGAWNVSASRSLFRRGNTTD